jgi:hypothetical protein
MTAKAGTVERQQNASATRKPHHRAMPFAGLLLMVPVWLVAGVILWSVVRDNTTARVLIAIGSVVAATLLAEFAFHLGEHRRSIIRWHVVVTIVTIGLGEAITMAVGMPLWWALVEIFIGIVLAISWALYRLDNLRHNPSEQVKEDQLTKKLGLENTKFGKPVEHRDASGEVTRIEIPVKHGPGETVDVIQAAVPGIESLANAPRGRSRAVPGEGAGTSKLTIITKDTIAGLLMWPGPSAPCQCITVPLCTGQYEDQQPALRYIAGGCKEAPNPSSQGWMGMTRTGKTMEAQDMLLELVTRTAVHPPIWFDTIKGAQTVRPLRDGLDVIVASDDPKTFRAGMKALVNLVKVRANLLGECGYRSWEPVCAVDLRLRMGLLYAHFEESDALCDIAPDEMVFLASKGLSTGVVCGFSLQRASAEGMPTGLRFNVGTWACFGCGDEYSAGFALSNSTIDAGAHPEVWKQGKPGCHYLEGIGIPEDRWPVARKAYYFEDDVAEAHVTAWAPQMMPLDQGSIEALGDWYTKAKADTVTLVARWGSDTPVTSANTNQTAAVTAPTSTPTPTPDSDDDDAVTQVKEEIDEMRLIIDIEPETAAIDPGRPIPPPAGGDGLEWGREQAPDRETAIEAFERALTEVAADESLRDPSSDDAVVFQVATLVDRYKFRSRPWFSEALTAMVEGEQTFPGLILERTDVAGRYRLHRTNGDHRE